MTISTILFLDFGIQFVVFCYSAYHKTEKYYDVTGSLTFQLCILVSLLNASWPITARQVIAAIGLLIWSGRLGLFLYSRVQTHPDVRFDKIKRSPVRFAGAWFAQGLWILVTALPVFLCVASDSHDDFGIIDAIGITLWIIGFTIESVADTQKSSFKAIHPNDMMMTGIWKYSRYK